MLRVASFVLALLLLSACAGLAAPAAARFEEGVRAYDTGDYARAHAIWLDLARQGDLAAQRNLGHLYRRGLGVAPDPEQAALWYRRAAERGLVAAQVNLGVLYLRGEGVRKDPAEAARWFMVAAQRGHAGAQYNIARMYEIGLGVAPDPARALGWYYIAARNGHGPALERLGALVATENPLAPPAAEMLPELAPPPAPPLPLASPGPEGLSRAEQGLSPAVPDAPAF